MPNPKPIDFDKAIRDSKAIEDAVKRAVRDAIGSPRKPAAKKAQTAKKVALKPAAKLRAKTAVTKPARGRK